MTTPALRLWTGKTVHKRFAPFERRFQYNIFLIDLDIDRLDEAGRCNLLFAVGRPSLFSFQTRDHGPKAAGTKLRPWAEEMLQSAGVDLEGGEIRLVTFPRHLFYKFAPLSLWYGYGPAGDLRGIIYEVNNTFGEQHCYVASAGARQSQHEAPKAFHVSPFLDVSGRYRFTLQAPDECLRIVVENWDGDRRTHMASIVAKQAKATDFNLLRQAITQPFASMGVTVGIHWQALKIWLRGAGYRRRPIPPVRPATIAKSVRGTVQERREEPV